MSPISPNEGAQVTLEKAGTLPALHLGLKKHFSLMKHLIQRLLGFPQFGSLLHLPGHLLSQLSQVGGT